MLRVMDAPGYYAAFPWGVTRGKRGTLPRQPTLRSEEHLQREGDSQFRGGPFGGRAMVQGDTGARSANLLRAS